MALTETGAVISIWIGTAVSTDAVAGTWSGHAQIHMVVHMCR